ncbi:hypothetical protein HMF8227_02008 [Saliniradius amylolyticus]|uniref:Glyoxalase/fosfomycin resistance/dioxygenase domain-containing protein n=1 Tax=Saliniradius amylolyticus TaxID=2183582 RepID=A0A2S2E495_9ALTE|nr:VOC family protein [Saliniradius amylolyticus]AWL12478.1 hypothetical protein HMF8227_02008 [Saliniradius amylolyticus]
MKPNPVGWFEIPCLDIERAKLFYHNAFDAEFEQLEMGPCQMAMFPYDHDKPQCTGALVQGPDYEPNHKGVLIYFVCDEVTAQLTRINSAGGRTLEEKMSIGEHGFIGLFEDSEGNRLGLHSMK